VVVLIQGVNLTVAWLGDSQVVLCKAGDAVQLMEPHKPDRQVIRYVFSSGSLVKYNHLPVCHEQTLQRFYFMCYFVLYFS